MKPQLRAVDNNQPHARDIAAQRVKDWRSNAEQESLPVTNVHDDKGAKVLDVDTTLKWEPEHLGKQ